MLLRMQIPPCSHGGSHFALGSKTNPTATPRGASEPAEQTPTRATKAYNSTVEPRLTKFMFGCVLSLIRGEAGIEIRPMELEEKVPYKHRDFSASSTLLHAGKLTYSHGSAGRGSVLVLGAG